MPIDAIGVVCAGPNRTGRGMLLALGKGHRYSHLSGPFLQMAGIDEIRSCYLHGSSERDISLVIFSGGYFDNDFVQLTLPHGTGVLDFSCSGPHSAMLVASAPDGAGQTMLSYQTLFRHDWDEIIDDEIGSDGWRSGEPVLTWAMFTENPDYTDLSSDLGYLKVHQDLVLKTPSWWPWNYEAWLEYWIYLYPSAGNVRAVVPQHRCWVEGGVFHGSVADRFRPLVKDGAQVLEDKLNEKLAAFDGLTHGSVKDIFLLPGSQSAPPAQGDVWGNTGDDVTIVVAM